MSSQSASIILQIEGVEKKEESPIEWESSYFLLDGRSRGDGKELPQVTLTAGSVLELELENGVSILVPAEDAERYLGPVGVRSSGEQVLQVGKSLRFTGVRQPAGLARDSFGTWLIKGLRVFRQSGVSAATAVTIAGTFQDRVLDDHNGLYRCSADQWQLSPMAELSRTKEPNLLFLHGTASSSAGSFQGLWEQGFNSRLEKLYGNRIYAFEHRSLTESPVANALSLVEKLPEQTVLHLVSHSRGGMIGELLARANRIGNEPISGAEIERFREQGIQTGREGYAAEEKLLKDLNAALLEKRIRVDRFVRVACPVRGTTLASGKLDRWATVMLNLLGKGFDFGTCGAPALQPVLVGYDLLKRFLLAVVKERTDARILPGLEAMMPDSPLVALLNNHDVEITPPVHIIAGDWQGDNLLSWLGDCVTEIFYGGATDLVVNTPSMSGGAVRREGIWQKEFIGPTVLHTRYFDHQDSAEAVCAALAGQNDGFTRLAEPSQVYITRSRGGREIKKREDAPIVFLLPGTMGSHIQVNHDRIWFDPVSLIGGGIDRLSIDSTADITPDGWFDHYYEELARFLAATHEVRPFVYDWRRSIIEAADGFGVELDKALADAERRNKPVRIVAHSMGGLVARLALAPRWEAFKALPGSRLLQLGTPNNGSHSMAAVLLGRDDFVQSIERWLDWKHDMRGFLDIVGRFPGVLEMLPWPTEGGVAIDGVDYFAERPWQKWHSEDVENSEQERWPLPSREALEAARHTVGELQKAEIDARCSFYVAGFKPTPAGVKLKGGRLGLEWSDEGDGRVLWRTGIPAGVPVWYVKAAHGDLPRFTRAFPAYLDIIEKGTTSTEDVSVHPPAQRGMAKPVFIPRSLTANGLYPTVDEVMAAAVGGTSPTVKPLEGKPSAVKVVHGSLALAESPVLLGYYAGDGLRGSARFLDRHLEGALTRAYNLGRYPRCPEDAVTFYHPEAQGKPAGTIVVGLGPLGQLTPGALTQALTTGLLEYVRCEDQKNCGKGGDLEVSSLLVGSGFIGLTIEVCVRCQLEALKRANCMLGAIGSEFRIAGLTIYEEVLDRAINAMMAIQDLSRDSLFSESICFQGRLTSARGGYRGRAVASGGQPGVYRVHIATYKDEKTQMDQLHFTLMTDQARNSVEIEPDQRPVVDGLIRTATQNTRSQKGLSRTLFELLVPNEMKSAVADVRTLMLSVDPQSAVYPWELMRDAEEMGNSPLASRIELIRQLATDHGRNRVQTVRNRRVLVVGDTQSGLLRLDGARQEAKDITARFANHDYEVRAIYGATAQELFEALFDTQYRFIHLAGHGAVKDKNNPYTGMVLEPGVFLSTAQISKMRHVPEFVFINCCHLGNMTADANPRWGELAANLATQFIEMGCKAVIAAGWAVDDLAASTFATEFYDNMLHGYRFGRAVQLARQETYRLHSATNTWGAFQAYGDEQYRFPGEEQEDESFDEYVHPDHLIADLDLLTARLACAVPATVRDFYTARITKLEEVGRRTFFKYGSVREKFGDAWKALGDKERTIAHYRAALACEDGEMSLRGLEQLANMETRYGAELYQNSKDDQGAQYLNTGIARLKTLIELDKTAERLALLGSAWKRKAHMLLQRGRRKELNSSLSGMTEQYDKAAEFTYLQSGTRDYYPTLNGLDGAFICAMRGIASGQFKRYRNNLDTLLQEAGANAARRYEEQPDFFHALAKVELQRVKALYGCLERESPESIINAKVQQHLIQAYRAEMRAIGSAGEHDSVRTHLEFLISALPAKSKVDATIDMKGIQMALQSIIVGIRMEE